MKSTTHDPEQLVLDHWKLLYWVWHHGKVKYPLWRRLGKTDCIGYGVIGLWAAAKKWDGDRGEFSTYAVCCIRREMCRGVEAVGPIRIPERAWKGKFKEQARKALCVRQLFGTEDIEKDKRFCESSLHDRQYQTEQMECLEEVLQTINPRWRWILEQDTAEVSLTSMGRQLQCTKQNVMQILQRARRVVREKLLERLEK